RREGAFGRDRHLLPLLGLRAADAQGQRQRAGDAGQGAEIHRITPCGSSGSTSSGMGLMNGLPSRRRAKSAFASAINAGSANRAAAVAAMPLAAWAMPLWARADFPCATSCQEWPGVPT